jgi:Ras-related protein Rab-11A
MQNKVPQFKVILIGDSGVGKTSMISRATQDTFDPDNTTNTIGFCFQQIFKEIKNKGCLKLYIWDTAGQEMYKSMIKMYYRGVSVAIVVYDVGDRASFESIENWLKDVREK